MTEEEIQFESLIRWIGWVLWRQGSFQSLPWLITLLLILDGELQPWLVCLIGWALSTVFPVLVEFLLAKPVE
jgi:hypothetical protein